MADPSMPKNGAPQRLVEVIALAALSISLTSAAQSPTPLDTPLSQAAVQSAFKILRQEYVRRDELSFETLNQAALAGLLEHLESGALLVPAHSGNHIEITPKVHHTLMTTSVAWVRPTAFVLDEIPLMQSAIEELAAAGATHLILDLRHPAEPGSFSAATAMLDLFFPSGLTLFRMRRTDGQTVDPAITTSEPIWTGDLVVLVDETSNNVAETVAAVLKQQKRAWLVGAPTAGATVRYQTIPLDENWALQLATAEMIPAEGQSIFRKGLQPDLVVAFPEKDRVQVERLIDQNRARELVHEVARPRFNEAALVARRNPELDVFLNRSLGRSDSADRRTITDPVMQRAVDLFVSRSKLGAPRFTWSDPVSEPQQNTAPPRAIPVTKP